MNILSAAVSAAANTMVVCVQILFLSVITEKRCSKIRLAVIIFAAAVTSFIFELWFYGDGYGFKFLLLFFELPKFCLLTLIALKTFGIKEIMITMIIQFLYLTLNAAITALFPTTLVETNPYIGLIPMIAVPACMLIPSIILKRESEYRNKIINEAVSDIPVHICILIFIALFLEDGLIEVLCYITTKIELQIRTVKVLSLLLIICVTVLIISLTVNVLYQKYYVRLNNVLEEQINSQLLHYEKREKINSEIRSFRHDFNNHVRCLESLMSTRKFDEATAYLEKISGTMPSVEFLFRTGNFISDAILTEAQENSAPDNITISFKGYIPQNVDSTDLCIILSNALKNATEACRDLSGGKTVSVYGNYQQEVLVLIIKNPTALEGYAKDVFPKTSKSDKLSHGFGLSNIRHTVKKYDGTIHTLIEDGFFTLSVTLKLQ